MRLSVMLLLFLFTNVGHAVRITFKASGILSCGYHNPWCYFITLFESGHRFRGGKIDTDGVRCSRQREQLYELEKTKDGFLPGQPTITLFFVVTHNCTWNGSKLSAQRLPLIGEVRNGEVEVIWDKELTKVGERVDEYNDYIF